MRTDSRLYGIQRQHQQQHKNDHEYQIERRQIFYSHRSYKYLILLAFLALYTFNVLDEESNEFKRILRNNNADSPQIQVISPTHQEASRGKLFDKLRALMFYIPYRSDDTERGEGEVSFKSATMHTSQVSITIVGVEPRFPNVPEIRHLESTLFYLLNFALRPDNIHIMDALIMTEMSELTVDVIDEEVIDEEQSEKDEENADDDDGENADDDDRANADYDDRENADDDDDDQQSFVQNQTPGQDLSSGGFLLETMKNDNSHPPFINESLESLKVKDDAEQKPAKESLSFAAPDAQGIAQQDFEDDAEQKPAKESLSFEAPDTQGIAEQDFEKFNSLPMSEQQLRPFSGFSVERPKQHDIRVVEPSIGNRKTNELNLKEARFSNWGDGKSRKRRNSESVNLVHTLKVQVKVTSSQFVTEETERIEDLLWTAIDINPMKFIKDLISGDELPANEKATILYYRNLRNIECTGVIDARAGIEDPRGATTLPPRLPTSAPTSGPTDGERKRAAPREDLTNDRMNAPPIETAIDINFEPIGGGISENVGSGTSGNISEEQPKLVTSKANEYRNISACIFVVTLVMIGFWNMVRLNRKQVERRRRKVELAKVAYQAPLSMTHGVMDVGMGSRDGFVPSVATVHNYDTPALDDDRYIGTMDKNTHHPL